MPWFYVNGMPVLARSKTEATKLFKEGKLVRLHSKELTEELREIRYGNDQVDKDSGEGYPIP